MTQVYQDHIQNNDFSKMTQVYEENRIKNNDFSKMTQVYENHIQNNNFSKMTQVYEEDRIKNNDFSKKLKGDPSSWRWHNQKDSSKWGKVLKDHAQNR